MIFGRFFKQIIIGSLFLLLVAGVSFWIWYVVQPKPTCYDGMQNQNETGIDCGGICAVACEKEPAFKEVSVDYAKFFEVAPYTYDVLGEVRNGNPDFGSPSFRYEFTLLDATGTVLAARQGDSYILPSEKKLIAAQRLETGGKNAVSAKLVISDNQWIELDEFSSIALSVRNSSFGPAAGGYKASGVVVNDTGYDFEEIDVIVVLLDKDNNAIGAAPSVMNALRDKQQRSFETSWPINFDNRVVHIILEANTNLLANNNFLTRYGLSRQRYQQEIPVLPGDRKLLSK
jgi:hypothetical protein